jgi:hypothetical protein
MSNRHDWPREFAIVISCTRCSDATDRRLLRDAMENVPQPGFIGDNYWRCRVLLVAQNPGTAKSRQALKEDMPHTAALRAAEWLRYYRRSFRIEEYAPGMN